MPPVVTSLFNVIPAALLVIDRSSVAVHGPVTTTFPVAASVSAAEATDATVTVIVPLAVMTRVPVVVSTPLDVSPARITFLELPPTVTSLFIVTPFELLWILILSVASHVPVTLMAPTPVTIAAAESILVDTSSTTVPAEAIVLPSAIVKMPVILSRTDVSAVAIVKSLFSVVAPATMSRLPAVAVQPLAAVTDAVPVTAVVTDADATVAAATTRFPGTVHVGVFVTTIPFVTVIDKSPLPVISMSLASAAESDVIVIVPVVIAHAPVTDNEPELAANPHAVLAVMVLPFKVKSSEDVNTRLAPKTIAPAVDTTDMALDPPLVVNWLCSVTSGLGLVTTPLLVKLTAPEAAHVPVTVN